MKFPYELSEQRISLLSKEDQAIYRYEHSDYYDLYEKQKGIYEYQKALLEKQGYYVEEIKNDDEYSDLNETEIQEMAKVMAMVEAETVIDSIANIFKNIVYEGGMTQEEWKELQEKIRQELNDPTALSLNEATDGPDMTYWAKGIGGLFGVAFTGLFGGIAGLIMAGKTKKAIEQLEDYMNKIVETIDDGAYKSKRKPSRIRQLFNRILRRDDKSMAMKGDRSKGCMRYIQEMFTQKITCQSMILLKNLGFLSPNCNDAIRDMESNLFHQGGMEMFFKNIAGPVNELSSKI